MSDKSGVELQVYVEGGCGSCERALRIATLVDHEYAALMVRVIDVSEQSERDDDVFAVPTFVLDGQLFSLGNPNGGLLREAIEALLKARSAR